MVGAAAAIEMRNNFENAAVSYLTDSLTGILKEERLEKKAEK